MPDTRIFGGLGCALACLALFGGCISRDLGPIDPKVSRAIDVRVRGDGVTQVDLLFVVDDSQSMQDEQSSLRREIPRLIAGLTSPPDEDGDGAPDWNAVESLGVAVVSTDLGTNGVEARIGGCGLRGGAMDANGRDGQLRSTPECGGPVQRWEAGDDPAPFIEGVSCLAEAGIQGCGIEQPLGAAVRALEESAAIGFPRAGALLAVVVLTDEEDCSVADPAAFYGSLPTGPEASVHCVRNEHLLTGVDELVRGLRQGRDDSELVFAAITGIPEDVQEAAIDEVLADPRMQVVEDLTTDLGVRPACQRAAAGGELLGHAAPGRRLLEVARAIPGSLVRSICAESYQGAITELTRRIGARVRGACLNRALVPAEDGSVDCVVRETLPAGMRCAELPARSPWGVGDDGREICEVTQAAAGGSGWYYDVADATCDRVAFSEDALPPIGASVRFMCLVQVEDEVPGDVSPWDP